MAFLSHFFFYQCGSVHSDKLSLSALFSRSSVRPTVDFLPLESSPPDACIRSVRYFECSLM